MWEKCGTYSGRERAEGAVRHVLPQARPGEGWGGIPLGGGGVRRTPNRDQKKIEGLGGGGGGSIWALHSRDSAWTAL